MSAAALWPALRDARLIVACGAGGVGKTTVSAALGLALAREGKRVLVLTVDPARRLADALGHELGPGPQHVQLPGEPAGLDAAMLDPPTTFRRIVDELPVSTADRERLLASRITRELTTGDAGMQELMAIVELQHHHVTGAYDAIVLDTPPALHALELLDGPERIVGLVSGRTVGAISRAAGLAGRLGRLPGPGQALGRLWGAELMAEIAAFLDAAAPFGRALQRDLDAAEELLRSADAAFVLVTAPAESPLRVAAELAEELGQRGHPVAGTIVNRRRVPPALAADPTALGPIPLLLQAAGHSRTAVLASQVVAIAAHERDLLAAAALPEPQQPLTERLTADDPAAVLGGLADELTG